MNLKRKLKTARKILLKYGLKEVFILLERKIELHVKRLCLFSISKLRRLIYKLIHNVSVKNKDKEKTRILYIIGRMESEIGQTVRYRIHNLREALKSYALTKYEILENGVYKDEKYLEWADLIVLMRVESSPMTDSLIKIAHKHVIPVVYDIDDIIFLQEYAEKFCEILGDHSEESYRNFFDQFGRQEQTFRSADFATTSTPYIAGIMEDEGKAVYVIHNGLNQKQIRIGEKVAKKPKPDIVYIGYLSGSMTHNKDFLQAVPALMMILQEYKNVKINLVGYIDMENLPKELTRKTETTSFMKWQKLLKHSARNYINIAPLDISNPFCHAKSELKYFESAIVGVPTVASATDTYKRCIETGVNGMLATNTFDWHVLLKALLENDFVYETLKKNARQHVLEKYAPEAIAREAMSAYQTILQIYQKDKAIKISEC